ncbi:zinc finger protein JAGGED-like [Rutidosis leptorrhynchoides]|uniref:zinc finger protein JAGGED-like n=1 Tax=Rutidosis leptorrhynchoides TaxID=125765 RepID=UPI003A997786
MVCSSKAAVVAIVHNYSNKCLMGDGLDGLWNRNKAVAVWVMIVAVNHLGGLMVYDLNRVVTSDDVVVCSNANNLRVVYGGGGSWIRIKERIDGGNRNMAISFIFAISTQRLFIYFVGITFVLFDSSRENNNPLDLNIFPFNNRDHGKQTLDDSSSYAALVIRKKKKAFKKQDKSVNKVYECRFCSLKFFKSEALGGHMNRHRKEKEMEELNRARQLVFSKDNHLPQLPHQLGGQPVVHGGFHHSTMGTTLYPTILFSGTPTTVLPPPPPQQTPPHMYTSSTSQLINNNHPYSSQYPINDYFVPHFHFTNNPPPPFSFPNITGTSIQPPPPPPESSTNHTCISALVGQSFTLEGSNTGRDMSLHL